MWNWWSSRFIWLGIAYLDRPRRCEAQFRPCRRYVRLSFACLFAKTKSDPIITFLHRHCFYFRIHLPFCPIATHRQHSDQCLFVNQPWVSIHTIFTDKKVFRKRVIKFNEMYICSGDTWMRVSIWLALGALIYLFYGRNHSSLENVIYVPAAHVDEIYESVSQPHP